MSSYINVFSGVKERPSNSPYLAIDLQGDIELSWPTDFQNTNLPVSSIMDITVDPLTDYKITLPDAKNVTVGECFRISNDGLGSFSLYSNSGSLLKVFDVGDSFLFYLTNNSTSGGVWRSYSQEASDIISLSAVSPEENLTISGSPIVSNSGTLNFSFRDDEIDVSEAVRVGAEGGPQISFESASNLIKVTTDNKLEIMTRGTGTLSISSENNINIETTGTPSASILNIISSEGDINLQSSEKVNFNARTILKVYEGEVSSLILLNDSDQGASFKASEVMTGPLSLTLPVSDASVPGQLLCSDGTGQLFFNDSQILEKRTTVNGGEIQTLELFPKTIIPAVPGKVIIVLSYSLIYKFDTAAYTDGGNLYIAYDGDPNKHAADFIAPDALYGVGVTGEEFIFAYSPTSTNVLNLSEVENKPIMLVNSGDAFQVGGGPIEIILFYALVDATP